MLCGLSLGPHDAPAGGLAIQSHGFGPGSTGQYYILSLSNIWPERASEGIGERLKRGINLKALYCAPMLSPLESYCIHRRMPTMSAEAIHVKETEAVVGTISMEKLRQLLNDTDGAREGDSPATFFVHQTPSAAEGGPLPSPRGDS